MSSQRKPRKIERHRSISVTISLSPEKRDMIDRRAAALGLDRSTYLVVLATQDSIRSDFVITPQAAPMHPNGSNVGTPSE